MHMTQDQATLNPAIKAAIEKANARKLPLFDGAGVFAFEVYGDPIAQGSLAMFYDQRGNQIVKQAEGLEPWRRNVADAAARAMLGRAPVGKHKPLLLGCVFRLARPPKGKPGHDACPDWPTLGRDFDKLKRAIGDALTGVVYADDGQIVGALWPDCKRYAREGERPGVSVRIAPVALAQKELLDS